MKSNSVDLDVPRTAAAAAAAAATTTTTTTTVATSPAYDDESGGRQPSSAVALNLNPHLLHLTAAALSPGSSSNVSRRLSFGSDSDLDDSDSAAQSPQRRTKSGRKPDTTDLACDSVAQEACRDTNARIDLAPAGPVSTVALPLAPEFGNDSVVSVFHDSPVASEDLAVAQQPTFEQTGVARPSPHVGALQARSTNVLRDANAASEKPTRLKTAVPTLPSLSQDARLPADSQLSVVQSSDSRIINHSTASTSTTLPPIAGTTAAAEITGHHPKLSMGKSTSPASGLELAQSDDIEAQMWKRLETLKALLARDFISQVEYDKRKAQIIDDMTGTHEQKDRKDEKKLGCVQLEHEKLNVEVGDNAQNSIASSYSPPQQVGSGSLPEQPKRQHSQSMAVLRNRVSERVDRDDGFGLRHNSHQRVGDTASSPLRPRAMTTAVDNRRHFGKAAVPETQSPFPSEEELGRFDEQVAMKFVFNLHTHKWQKSHVRVRMDPVPFAVGGLRRVHHMQETMDVPATGAASDISSNSGHHLGGGRKLVAKIAKNVNAEPPETYFRDVEMQVFCRHYANLFNARRPPKRIQFAPAWVIKVVDKEKGTARFYGVEPYLAGPYNKYNNNCGFVGVADRNTPQAFSHFTYEASNRKLIIVDIQGVGDLYTDPQIHTVDNAFSNENSSSNNVGAVPTGSLSDGANGGGGQSRSTFGKGNLGNIGIIKFFSTHRCNSICRLLNLPPMNPKASNSGTQVAGIAVPGNSVNAAGLYATGQQGFRDSSRAAHGMHGAQHRQHSYSEMQPPSHQPSAQRKHTHRASFSGWGYNQHNDVDDMASPYQEDCESMYRGGARASHSHSSSRVVGLESSRSLTADEFNLTEDSSMSVASSDIHSVEAWDAPPRSAHHHSRQVDLMASTAPTPAAARGSAGRNGVQCGCSVM